MNLDVIRVKRAKFHLVSHKVLQYLVCFWQVWICNWLSWLLDWFALTLGELELFAWATVFTHWSLYVWKNDSRNYGKSLNSVNFGEKLLGCSWRCSSWNGWNTSQFYGKWKFFFLEDCWPCLWWNLYSSFTFLSCWYSLFMIKIFHE